MVRYLPRGSTKWHPSTDHLAGTTPAYGVPGINSAPWGIRFDTIPFTQFAFATGDAISFIIALKDVILPGIDYDNIPLNFIRTSLSPDAEGMSVGGQFNRAIFNGDPHLSLA